MALSLGAGQDMNSILRLPTLLITLLQLAPPSLMSELEWTISEKFQFLSQMMVVEWTAKALSMQ